jgi:flagellar basal-body rod protein FlgG
MNDSMYIAATGMQMQQKSVDTIANNLANVNTPGFKKGRVSFEDLVYRGLGQAQGAPGLSAGSGVGIRSIAKLFAQGDLKRTDLPLDVAIQGDGFLEVTLPDGTQGYSRGGSLMVDSQGFLATAEGQVLKPAIQVGADARNITIHPDGRVTAQNGERGEPVDVGRIELARFNDTSGLVAQGTNLYRPSEQSGDAIYGRPGEDGSGALAQGFVESSNVKLIEEMVDLMVAQRAYESSVKVIQAADEMLAMSNNLRK